uniref:NADH-ubiquinone oxidoreductase chain 1 n=1 Tax=Semnoderes armiger TaxID=1415233 RepID=A0A5H2Q8H2_9BILA|nr:NADH dehydrogenase subunit 1 [Semnoderes armiger]AYF57116.1 NADH dehydrogenase subunit 1 [Semnoderes armiger]
MMFVVYLGLLMSIAFITLMEQKVLGYVHIRKGPNKVNFIGWLQPFSDAGKLFSKGVIFFYQTSFMVYLFSPLVMMFLMLVLWCSHSWGVYNFSLGLFFFFCLVALGVYPLIFCGWSSNSKFSILGCLRAVAQSISYEVCLITMVMSLYLVVESYSFSMMVYDQYYLYNFFFLYGLSMMLLMILVAELGRTPFDFIEGESELVSGFNIEFGSGLFAMVFMSEYGMIIFMSFFFMYGFFGEFMGVVMVMLGLMVSFIMIIIRGELPRTRYDKLMLLCWEVVLPLILMMFLGLGMGFLV